jgi:hypothetical protein
MRITVSRISNWLRAVAEVCIAIYLTFTCLSLIMAHALLVYNQHSAVAEAIIAPVSRGLQFIDDHWKATLLLVSPLIWPVLRHLVLRVTKAWGVEFEPVVLQQVDRGQIQARRREE